MYKIIEAQFNGETYYSGYVVGLFGIKRWFMLWCDGWPYLPDLTIWKFSRDWITNKEYLEKYLKEKSAKLIIKK